MDALVAPLRESSRLWFCHFKNPVFWLLLVPCLGAAILIVHAFPSHTSPQAPDKDFLPSLHLAVTQMKPLMHLGGLLDRLTKRVTPNATPNTFIYLKEVKSITPIP